MKTYIKTIIILYAGFLLSLASSFVVSGVVSAQISCSTLYTKIAEQNSPLSRLEPNAAFAHVKGSYLIDTSHSQVGSNTVPQSVSLASSVARAFSTGVLKENSVTEIILVDSLDQVTSLASSRSGSILRTKGTNVVVDRDASNNSQRVKVYVLRSALDDQLNPKLSLDKVAFDFTSSSATVHVPIENVQTVGSLIQSNPKIHTGGLVSISAEPPEGFFAASTSAELQKSGWKISGAKDSEIWIYRVPDTREDSYFRFLFPSADRPQDVTYTSKFKIATGTGPAANPASRGGAEANLLWLGDEQGGTLTTHLQKISRPQLSLDDLYDGAGFVQKLDSNRVVVAGIDRAHALTKAGFESLETEPELYRRVFSKDYDASLAKLFEKIPGPQPKGSYLLATSRGCTQGCTICCSGGLKAFQSFSASRIMEELSKVASHSNLGPKDKLDIFFIDSNFNNDPSRIVDFAKLYRESPLYGQFNFYVRHNTVNGFLSAPKNGIKEPRLDVIKAYRELGIKEVFMGIDTFDDASTQLLKTNRIRLEKEGTAVRPTYTVGEVRSLIAALEKEGLTTKGFFLNNNPWVSDLDRVDSYYNVLRLWLENKKFSIDSRKSALQLKPLVGSPIEQVSSQMDIIPVKSGRYVTSGPLGELDERMNFGELSTPRIKANIGKALKDFQKGVSAIKSDALRILQSTDVSSSDRKHAEQVLAKILSREDELKKLLSKDQFRTTGAAKALIVEINDFAKLLPPMKKLNSVDQSEALKKTSESLISGLGSTRGSFSSSGQKTIGYPAEIAGLTPSVPHTVKDLNGYLSDNLSKDLLDSTKSGTSFVIIAVGEGKSALKNVESTGIIISEQVVKNAGYHQVYRATNPSGEKGYVINRVNGDDRILHIQSLLKLSGVDPSKVSTVGATKSWKQEYLETFKKIGHVPDAVIYGFANTASDTILLQNAKLNDKHFDYLSKIYKTKFLPVNKQSNDFDGNALQIIELENGKRIWLLNCFYGDLSRDLASALVEHGAKDITFLGTAGALNGKFKVGDVVTPKSILLGGKESQVNVTPFKDIPQEGKYLRVSTPNIETKHWLKKSQEEGVDIVEVELDYWLELMSQHPDRKFRAGVIVSDVLDGPNAKDMTEWGTKDTQALRPKFRDLFFDVFDTQSEEYFRVKNYRAVPLVDGAKVE